MVRYVAILLSSMQCVEGFLKNFNYWCSVVFKQPITSKNQRRHVDVMNIDKGIHLPDLNLSSILLLKTDIVKKKIFHITCEVL